MRLILIRHGQTPSNLLSQLDTAVPGAKLTAAGTQQALELVTALAEESIDAIFASTQHRAQLTAEPLAQSHGLTVTVRDGLREIDAGDLEMRNDASAISTYERTFVEWAHGRLDLRMPGGESGTEAFTRFENVLDEASSAGHDTVAFVSHGALIRSWVGWNAQNLDADFVRIQTLPNAEYAVLDGAPDTGWLATQWAQMQFVGGSG